MQPSLIGKSRVIRARYKRFHSVSLSPPLFTFLLQLPSLGDSQRLDVVFVNVNYRLAQARWVGCLVDVRNLKSILVHLVKLHSRSISLDQMLRYILKHLVHAFAGFARRFVYSRDQIVTLFAKRFNLLKIIHIKT